MTSLILLVVACMLSCTTAEFSDEMQVYNKECLGENRMHCADGTCIWQQQWCDGTKDCADGSDEAMCARLNVEPHQCTGPDQYLCMDQRRCIPLTWVCNNITDCEDHSDEADCTTEPEVANVTAPCKGFVCKSDKRCISSYWACDGSYDCEDHSDEAPDTCRHHRSNTGDRSAMSECPLDSDHIHTFWPKMYECSDKSMCLNAEHMCDGVTDCKDGSDEGPFCRQWKTMCINSSCSANSTCYPDRSGRVCVCGGRFRYHFYNETTGACQPRNVCAEARPQCSQICEDRGGAFLCFCEEGYTYDRLKIGIICVAPDPEPKLFYSTANEINYVTLKSNKVVNVVTGIKQAHGLFSDGEYLYWVETYQGHQAIIKALLKDIDNTRQVIAGLSVEDPGDISVDWRGGNVYYSDAELGVITACRDGACATIKTDARIPKHLVLDVRQGNMYWADWDMRNAHGKPVIKEARMDGSECRVLVGDLTADPTGLTVDSTGGRLYFVDNWILKGARLDNGMVYNVSMRLTSFHRPYALAVFENILYWSDWASNSIQSSDKFTGVGIGLVLFSGASPVYGMHLYHPILQQAKSNPCAHHNCSHLCLLKSNASRTCACPDGMTLDADNVTCQNNKGSRPLYVVVASGNSLLRMRHDAAGSQPAQPVTYNDVGRVQAMAYDSRKDTLYIYDAKWKTLNYVNMSEFDRGVTRVLLHMGLDNVLDMDYDVMTDNLYLVDAGRRVLEVVSLQSGKRAVLHRFDVETPISLCVLPDYGKILVAVSENEQNTEIHVDSFGLDGSDRQHLLYNDLKGPHIVLRYSQKMESVYLADEGNSVIDFMNPEGKGRETYRSLSTSVSTLAVTDTLVLWGVRRGARLYWANIHDSSRQIRRMPLGLYIQWVLHVATVARTVPTTA